MVFSPFLARADFCWLHEIDLYNRRAKNFMRTKFQLLIKTKMLKIKTLLDFKHSDDLFIILIKVKMPTIVGILTFMRMIKFIHS